METSREGYAEKTMLSRRVDTGREGVSKRRNETIRFGKRKRELKEKEKNKDAAVEREMNNKKGEIQV